MDRRLWLTFGPAALLVGLGGGGLIVASDHEGSKAATLAVVLSVGWAFVAAGLIAWSREPANRIGRLMVLAGFTWLLVSLNAADSSFLFTVGVFLYPVTFAIVVHLLLAYPDGRLSSRADLVVVVLAYLDVTVIRVPWLFFWSPSSADCPDCPGNGVLIADEPDLARAFDAVSSAIGIALVAYVIVVFARRWRSATRLGRRSLAPVLASGAALLLAIVAFLVLDQLWSDAVDVAQWTMFGLLITVPAAFLAGLLQTRLAAAGASRLLIESPATPTPAETQEGLRRALGDPTLELAYWLPERGAYVDTAGNPVELPPDGEGRMTTPIDYDDRPVAALVHDEWLRREPELVEAVVAAARVAIEKDRLQAELHARLDELERERDFIRTIVNTAPSFFCVLDVEGTILRFNDMAGRMIGREDVRGRPFWEGFAAPEDAEAVRERLVEAASRGGSSELETELVSATGERLVLAWSSTPLLDARGRPRLLISGADVTDRRRQAQALQRERDLLETVVHATPSFMIAVHEGGRLSADPLNKAARRTLGYDADDLRGRDFVEALIAPEDAREAAELMARAFAGERTAEIDSSWLTKSGERLLIAWCATWLGQAHEYAEPLYLVTGTDVTQRMRQEAELRASRARIVEAADFERRRLERNLHDGAQQRLVTLSLTLRLVETRLGQDSDAARLLARARDELEQALEELRDLARGIHPAVLSDHGLGAALDALASRVPVPVRIDIAVRDRLPEPVEVAAYYVVSEALANVQKYAEASSVTIGVARENGKTVVEVSDDGVGGADADGGSGLRGLADRVEALGGQLEIESPAGEGTTVRAVIPS